MQFPSNQPYLVSRVVSGAVPSPRGLPGSIPPSLTTYGVRTPAMTLRRSGYSTVRLPRKPVASVVDAAIEPEDAHLTGATRSLTRRLLALNMRQAS